MTLKEELEPKLNDIEESAKEMYSLYLNAKGLAFDGNGLVVHDWDSAALVLETPNLHNEQNNWRMVSSMISSLMERFRTFYELDSADFREMRLELVGNGGNPPPPATAIGALHFAERDDVQPVDGLISEENWGGDGAEAFQGRVIHPFRSTAEQQMDYVRGLGVTLEAYRSASANAKSDIKKIADASIARLRGDYGEPHVGEHVGEFFSVVSILSDALSMIPSPVQRAAGVISFGASLISFFSEEAKAEPDDKKIDLGVTGENVQKIVESTWDAISRLDRLLSQLDERIWSGLNRYQVTLDSSWSVAGLNLELQRPVITGKEEAGFRRLTIRSIPGVSLSDSPVVLSVLKLYKAGKKNLPSAADKYDQALAHLKACKIPRSLETFFPRSIPKFGGALNRLTGAVRRTRDILTDAGAALVKAALNYELTDEENAEMLRKIDELKIR